MLLSEAFPIILECINATNTFSPHPKRHRFYDLDSESIELLLYLCGNYRQHGYSEYSILREINEPELKTEARLASLKELKLVSEKRSRREYEPVFWRITSEGKKYLFDYGHITDDMLRNR